MSKGCCQRASVRVAAVRVLHQRSSVRVAAVTVPAVRVLRSEGFCQSGGCERAAVRGLLAEWLLSESKSATKLLHSSVLVIHTARNNSKRQNCEINQKRPTTPAEQTWKSNPDPKRANPEIQMNPETQKPTQKEEN